MADNFKVLFLIHTLSRAVTHLYLLIKARILRSSSVYIGAVLFLFLSCHIPKKIFRQLLKTLTFPIFPTILALPKE